MSHKKSGNPWGVIFVIAAIGGLAYLGYTHPEYPAGVIAFFKGGGTPETFVPGPPLGTEDNPFDWSSWDNQVSTAPTLPEEGAQVYIRTASGNVRLVKAGEIKAAKDAYGKKQGVPARPAGSPAKQNVPVVHQTTSSVTTSPPESSSPEYIPHIDIDADILARSHFSGEFEIQRYKDAVRYLTDDDKIYLYKALSSESNINFFWEVLKTYIIHFNNDNTIPIPLKDFYIKPRREADFFYFDRFISYDRVTLPGGSFYEGKNDSKNGYFTASYPSEADRGGMNANFIQYDYVLQYKYEKSIPPELKPIIEAVKTIATKVDYDFSKAYGVSCKIKSGQVGGVCDNYADMTADMIRKAKIQGISTIYKVSSSKMNHAWVELVFKGKPVYVDPTWFDINEIWGRKDFTKPQDHGRDPSWLGYSISTPQEIGMDWDYEYVTYNYDLFNKGYSGKKYSHYLGGDAVKKVIN